MVYNNDGEGHRFTRNFTTNFTTRKFYNLEKLCATIFDKTKSPPAFSPGADSGRRDAKICKSTLLKLGLQNDLVKCTPM